MADGDEHIAAGDDCLRRRELAGAERCYRLALEADPGSANAMQSIGLLHAQRGDFQTALIWAKRAVEADPDYALGHNLLGNVLLALKRYEEALAALAKSPTGSTRAAVVLRYQMSLCHAGLRRWSEAEQTLRAAVCRRRDDRARSGLCRLSSPARLRVATAEQ
jgi:tetratricopeptide (TPR) repeat protein